MKSIAFALLLLLSALPSAPGAATAAHEAAKLYKRGVNIGNYWDQEKKAAVPGMHKALLE